VVIQIYTCILGDTNKPSARDMVAFMPSERLKDALLLQEH